MDCCREWTEIMLNVSADDPYYCGFSARVPNFVKQGKQKLAPGTSGDKSSQQQQPQPQHGAAGRDRDGGREGARPREAGGPKYREPGVLAGGPGGGQLRQPVPETEIELPRDPAGPGPCPTYPRSSPSGGIPDFIQQT